MDVRFQSGQENEFMEDLVRAYTTAQTNRGTANDINRISYDEALVLSATVNTPFSVRFTRKSEAINQTHTWFDQTLADAQDNPSGSGTILNAGSETADSTDDNPRLPVTYSNTMMKMDRSHSITDEMRIIAASRGFVITNDEEGRQLQYIMKVLMRDQERNILESMENGGDIIIVGQTSAANGARGTSFVVNASGQLVSIATIGGTITGYTNGETLTLYQPMVAASGGTAHTGIAVVGGGNLTGVTIGAPGGTKYTQTKLSEKRRMKGLVGDYKTATGAEATARGWIGSVNPSSTVLNLAGATVSDTNIEDHFNTLMRQIAEQEAGEDMPTTVYVASKLLNPLMKAAKKQISINVDLNELFREAQKAAQGFGNTGPKFVAGGAIGKYYCDFGVVDIVWHPMLTTAAAGGSAADKRKSRALFVNEDNFNIIDYAGGQGGWVIQPRPQNDPTQKTVVWQYLSLKATRLQQCGMIVDFAV